MSLSRKSTQIPVSGMNLLAQPVDATPYNQLI
jgi:hypothetical protein